MTAPSRAPAATGSALAALRSAGADGHRRVDRIVLERLRDLTDERYADLLADLAAVHLPIDGELRRQSPVAPRPVRDPLAADLAALGRALPEPGPTDDLAATPAGALGVLYVVEGSAAGGPTVAGLVRRRLGASAPVGFLLRAGGDRTWWQDLAAVVERSLSDPDDRAEAGTATQATFARFAHRLTR